MKNTQATLTDSLKQELRRGAVVLAALSQLDTEQYGYSLKRRLGDRGLNIDEGTLYPLLRRLESQGLLKSDWRVEDGRPRRYYRLSTLGQKTMEDLFAEWEGLVKTMEGLMK
ncbi:MAG: PadR family transcriptional regulator [Acidobacteriota bacterium]|nr:MAG: PadR family transcriptional regulator [Acidobacteriota bacterium]